MHAIIGIGVPGCGKTTYLKPLSEKLGYVYINGDDIRAEITGDASNHTREKEVWATARRRIRQALQRGGVVMDATHSRRSDRTGIIRYCKKHGATKVTGYWFNAPVETCLMRNAGRTRVVPPEAIRRMYGRLEENPPATDEGFDELIVIRD